MLAAENRQEKLAIPDLVRVVQGIVVCKRLETRTAVFMADAHQSLSVARCAMLSPKPQQLTTIWRPQPKLKLWS